MKPGGLSPDEIEQIAKRAAQLAAEPASDLAIAKMHQEVGRNVIRAAYWAVGVVITGLLAWLTSKGFISK